VLAVNPGVPDNAVAPSELAESVQRPAHNQSVVDVVETDPAAASTSVKP
jgi:hypothetical protein